MNELLKLNYSFFILADVDECKDKKACQCPECSCKNTWGSYDCSCSGDLLYIRDHDTCISELNTLDVFFLTQKFECACFHIPIGYSAGKTASQGGRSAWAAFWVIIAGLALSAGGGYLIYKYRIRVSFVVFSQFGDAIQSHLQF